jgi:hypothetical protein
MCSQEAPTVTDTTHTEKVRENRARRALDRQGYQLVKSRRRDPRAIDYGEYRVTAARGGRVVAKLGSLEQVERWIDGER